MFYCQNIVTGLTSFSDTALDGGKGLLRSQYSSAPLSDTSWSSQKAGIYQIFKSRTTSTRVGRCRKIQTGSILSQTPDRTGIPNFTNRCRSRVGGGNATTLCYTKEEENIAINHEQLGETSCFYFSQQPKV